MKRKFVSILALLPEVVKTLSDKSFNRLTMANDWINSDLEADQHPLFTVMEDDVEISEDSHAANGDEEHPLDAFRRHIAEELYFGDTYQEPAGGVRTIRIDKSCYSRYDGYWLHVGDRITIPYILELEYLKQSKFRLSEAELKLLDQMFILQVLNWYYYTSETLYRSPYENSNILGDLIQKLEEAESTPVYDLYLDEDGDALKELVAEIVKSIYAKSFVPMAEMPETGQFNAIRNYGATCQSTWDGLRIFCRKDGPRTPQQQYENNAEGLLYIPLLMVFHLLEMDTKELQSYNLTDYMEYRNLVPKAWIGDVNETAGERGRFSYGYLTRRKYDMREEDLERVNDDRAFLRRIMGHILKDIEDIAADRNLTVIPIGRLDTLKNQSRGKIAVLLNADKLEWGED